MARALAASIFQTMRFWRSLPGAMAIILLVGALAALSIATAQVYRVTHPARVPSLSLNLGATLAKARDVRLESTDGVPLSGWLFRGAAKMPAVLVCHDLGESKNAVINVAIALNSAGFTVLAFDFRAHGASGGSGSTLGIDEARDVLGAVDFLAHLPKEELDSRSIGIFGRGMGAQAAVLAAGERPALRVMVLDGLRPDARYALVRGEFADWTWGQAHLGAVPVALFPWVTGAAIGEHRAGDVLPDLVGRDLLLVSPEGDRDLAHAMKALYAILPDARDSERNLVTLPATGTSGATPGERGRYEERIVAFFRSRLVRS